MPGVLSIGSYFFIIIFTFIHSFIYLPIIRLFLFFYHCIGKSSLIHHILPCFDQKDRSLISQKKRGPTKIAEISLPFIFFRRFTV